jgi:HEAT repeat protein
LGKIGPAAKAALPRLLEVTAADESPAVRIEALQAVPLIAPDSSETITTLAQALSDPHSYVRNAAARELSVLGEKAIAAVPALITALQDPDEKVREAALQALRHQQAGPSPTPSHRRQWWEGQ